MRLFLNVTTRCVAVVIASALFATPARMTWAQGITSSDVEQQVRASLSVWDTRDPSRIMETPGPGGNYGAVGFGYRTEEHRAMSIEQETVIIRNFLASVKFYRITEPEIHTTVDGTLGWLGATSQKSFTCEGESQRRSEFVSRLFSKGKQIAGDSCFSTEIRSPLTIKATTSHAARAQLGPK